MKDKIRDRYIDVVGDQYATGTINEDELEAAVEYILETEDGPRDTRDHLMEHYDIPLMPLLPDFEGLIVHN